MSARRITDYSRFLSKTSALRQPSAIRALQPLMNLPGMISLGGGNPNPSTFPFAKASLTLRNGESVEIGEKDMAAALQYGASAGSPGLLSWLKQLQQAEHGSKAGLFRDLSAPGAYTPKDWDICIGTGSQDLLLRTFEMLLDPQTDSVLVESPCYSGVLAGLRPHLGANPGAVVGVGTDEHGLRPDRVDTVLRNWPTLEQDPTARARPRVLYTIPAGGNPTGTTQPEHRRRELYEVAREHDLLIVEDDPYYYLQYGEGERAPSFLALDEDARVLRTDSFSKIVSAGMRIGFATGPAPLVDRLVLHAQAGCLHPSGIAQATLLAYLNHIGVEGFLKHCDEVADFYRSRRDVFCEAADRHLKGLAEWHSPDAGMFVWFRLLGEIQDSAPLIRTKAAEKRVLLVPGESFMPECGDGGIVSSFPLGAQEDGSQSTGTSPYVRASFSTADAEQIDQALQRLAAVIREG
ncbi:hypothetical protein H696_04758 [Fonticula alba]|uniref:Aminotransferase class I/classII large domain-containing protein n=1 Tax=Fonticula alba TaxID=691883 RepID=A0A058Z2I6_FONAL|nr:hypothetical protein H696_04758 [Fonticula alba]KCV68464.1 hypothetical protein H696_04758 [Fonticula alba]|eukprot:XP_009496896.1 hypothetical protein H696_04758 [Fonticula alba]